MAIVNLKNLLNIKEKIVLKKENLPKHIAIYPRGLEQWARKNKRQFSEAEQKKYNIIKEFIQIQVKLDIPIMTFLILPKRYSERQDYPVSIDALERFFSDLVNMKEIKKNQIKVSVLGKWYDLPGRVIDPIKRVIEDTKYYDKFFINFCVNYNGNEEIVDACKIIGMKVKTGKLYPDGVDFQEIKENIYSSYFLPPKLIIITGNKRNLGGFMLWDSAHSSIEFIEKNWPEVTKTDLLKVISKQ